MDAEQQHAAKAAAAKAAAALVSPGMIIGLGSGSTASLLVAALGERARKGFPFVGVPTSVETEHQARALGIELATPDDCSHINLALDGADEVDPQLNAIKGLGGALFREKVVATIAGKFVLIVDESKMVDHLGTRTPVPVEVLPYGWRHVQSALTAMGADVTRRTKPAGDYVVTDNGNYILDCHFHNPRDVDWSTVAQRIKAITGVVDHGLFIGVADSAIVGRADGTAERRKRT